jgi:hypothetical protein
MTGQQPWPQPYWECLGLDEAASQGHPTNIEALKGGDYSDFVVEDGRFSEPLKPAILLFATSLCPFFTSPSYFISPKNQKSLTIALPTIQMT